ncbi:MAG: hypothetical protein IPM03_19940 [Sulfuritalea sp.]|jgi:hypothetical protein|nr:hypothetical protein [Sulfuritalea sp.]
MKLGMAIFAALWLGACGVLPTVPLQAAWYMQYSDKANARPDANKATNSVTQEAQLFVTLLNRGTRNIEVKDVILNRSEGENTVDLRLEADDKPLPSAKNGKLLLQPGRLLVIPLDRFKWVVKEKNGNRSKAPSCGKIECILPVEVAVVPVAEQHWLKEWVSWLQGEPEGLIRADLVGRLPSSLPEGWETKCNPLTPNQDSTSGKAK